MVACFKRGMIIWREACAYTEADRQLAPLSFRFWVAHVCDGGSIQSCAHCGAHQVSCNHLDVILGDHGMKNTRACSLSVLRLGIVHAMIVQFDIGACFRCLDAYVSGGGPFEILPPRVYKDADMLMLTTVIATTVIATKPSMATACRPIDSNEACMNDDSVHVHCCTDANGDQGNSDSLHEEKLTCCLGDPGSRGHQTAAALESFPGRKLQTGT